MSHLEHAELYGLWAIDAIQMVEHGWSDVWDRQAHEYAVLAGHEARQALDATAVFESPLEAEYEDAVAEKYPAWTDPDGVIERHEEGK